ncbi:MAG: NAD-dependent epimerase/dehydratase family protein [Chitinophagaceae bacterium]
MKKNVLVTGASGFIGSFIIEEAIKKNYQTIAAIRKSSSKKYLSNPQLNFIDLDLSKDEDLDKSLQKFIKEFGSLDYVIHTAGVTKSINKSDFDDVNFYNTKRFVEALQRNNLVPEKFVFISSLASYGAGADSTPIKANKQQQPLTEYGKSKLKAENYLRSIPNFPSITVNPTAVYGPRDKDFFVLLKSISNHVEVYINNDKQLLSFVHVNDLVDAIFIAMESSAFNQNLIVSDLENYTSRQFNDLVKKALNVKTVSIIIPAFIASFFAVFAEAIGHIKGKTPLLNRERLKEFKAKNWSVDATPIAALGYKPKYKLEEGLMNAISWYKKEGWIK